MPTIRDNKQNLISESRTNWDDKLWNLSQKNYNWIYQNQEIIEMINYEILVRKTIIEKESKDTI